MAKDQLARGARSASYGQGGIGESPLLVKLAEQELNPETPVTVEEPVQPFVRPEGPKFKFTPAGETVLVRQEEAADPAGVKTFTDQQSALQDKSKELVVIRDEEQKKQDAPAQGWIVAVGSYAGPYVPGDHVVFGKYAGAAFNLNGEWLLLMQSSEILGTLTEV